MKFVIFHSTTIGKHHQNARAEEKARLLQVAQAVAVDSAVTIPEGMTIELLEAKRGGAVDYQSFRAAMNQAITTIALSVTMTTDDGASLSQAQVHMDVRRELVEADAHLINDSFGRQVATWLRDWNFPGAAVPVVSRVMEPPPDPKVLAERDRTLAQMGWRLTRRYIENTYGVEIDAVAHPPASANPKPPSVALAEGEEEEDADPAGDRARRELGARIAAWTDAIREAAARAADLPALRRWLLDEAVGALDGAPLAADLGRVLVAAALAGRVDASEAPAGDAAAFAAPSEDGARLPFREQIEFFRSKVSLPSETWADLWEEQHDVAFIIAGATKADLVEDIRVAVDASIADGETLRDFRRRFDAIVEKHGWSYYARGKTARQRRDWRSRVIWQTNRRTSYAAGRYAQMKAVAEDRPFWRYRHSPASEEPRHDHLAWDGLVLRHDDPWWSTHLPPNGWGCQCYVETLDPDDLKSLGKEGPDEAPATRTRRVTVGRGAARRTVEVPEGIDPGFAYAPGARSQAGEAARHAIEASITQAPSIAAETMRKLRAGPPSAAKAVDEAAAKVVQEAADPLALPAFLRRRPGAPKPDLDAPGARAAHTDRPAETAAEFRRRPDYRRAKDLPGKAAAYYGDDDYGDINLRLREGRPLETSRARSIVGDMKSAMRETTEDIEVWRGRRSRKDYVVGEEIEEKAFGSWSTSYRTAQKFAIDTKIEGKRAETTHGTLYRLRLPKGNRAVVENEVEQEVLLAPDTKYRVAEIVDNADKGADRLYNGPSRVYILEVVEGTDGAG